MTRPDVPAIAGALILALPAAAGAVYSVLASVGITGPGAGGFSAEPVLRVLGATDTWRSLAWTIATAGVATGLAAAAACFVAIRMRASRAGQFLALLPLAVPHVAAALAALLLLGQSGLFSRLTYAVGLTTGPGDFPEFVYDAAGVSVMLAFAWKEFPYLTLTALAVLLSRSGQLEEVARTLGATPRQVFRRVTWPHLWRGISPAVLAGFAFLLGQYEIPALLAPSDPLALPLLTYERSVDSNLARRGEAHVLALLALTIAAAIVLVHARWRAVTEPES